MNGSSNVDLRINENQAERSSGEMLLVSVKSGDRGRGRWKENLNMIL